MSVIKNGKEFIVLDGEATVTDKLPVGTYRVVDMGMSGRHLLKEEDDFILGDQHVFGGREEKIDTITKTYENNPESLGVLLSGAKGIGKTLFSRMLSTWAHENNTPVILVDADSGVKGIANYLDTLPSNIMIMFDEFEKNFPKEYQQQFLGLFDGMSNHKRLYVITINNILALSEYMKERPGRLLFHIRFDYPREAEIKEYLQYHIPDIGKDDLNIAVNLANINNINYDILNAMVKMLKTGFKLKDVLQDLNIASIDAIPSKHLVGEINWKYKGKTGIIPIDTWADRDNFVDNEDLYLNRFTVTTEDRDEDGELIVERISPVLRGIQIKGKGIGVDELLFENWDTDERIPDDQYKLTYNISVKPTVAAKRINYNDLI